MLTLISIIHIVVAVFIVLLVLLQDSKGGAMGALGGGGGSNTVFGSSGGANFLVKLTRTFAIIFAATCISLAYMTSKTSSAVDKYVPKAAPAAEGVKAATPLPSEEDAKAKAEESAPAKETK